MSETWACNCIGPQNGQPKCPCGMRGVIERDGRWIQKEVDLGPVTRGASTDFLRKALSAPMSLKESEGLGVGDYRG